MAEGLVLKVKDSGKRIASLDLLRGSAILLMIAVNSLADYSLVPAWFKHAPGNGFTIADFVAPMFLFSLGFSYGLSFARRLTSGGTGRTVLHFTVRNIILFCMGFFGELLVHRRAGWGVLTMIGSTGIYAMVFMFLKPLPRLLLGFLFFTGYEAAALLGMPVLFFGDGLGGPAATAAFGIIVIAASCAGSWMKGKGLKRAAAVLGGGGGVLISSAALLSFVLPVNKHLVSSSYVLLTTGMSALVMLLFYLTADCGGIRFPFIGKIGRNALVLYILHHLFILLLNVILPPASPLYLVVPAAAVLLLVCGGTGIFLDWKGWHVRL